MGPESQNQNASHKNTVTVNIDGQDRESPKVTSPRDLKLLVKPENEVVAYDLQRVNSQGHVTKTWRANSQDSEEVHVHEGERFQLMPNGAPFS